MANLAAALAVTLSTAGRMCDILVRKGLIRPQRVRADRGAVQVSVTAIGLQVASEATARRRELIAGVLGKLPPQAVASDCRCGAGIARAAGEIPAAGGPQIPPAPSRRSPLT